MKAPPMRCFPCFHILTIACEQLSQRLSLRLLGFEALFAIDLRFPGIDIRIGDQKPRGELASADGHDQILIRFLNHRNRVSIYRKLVPTFIVVGNNHMLGALKGDGLEIPRLEAKQRSDKESR